MNNSQWYNFVNLCEDGFGECDFQESLISACYGHEDIAKVVFYHNGQGSIAWLQSEIPAMGGKVPKTEIKNGNVGVVHSVLLSFPC